MQHRLRGRLVNVGLLLVMVLTVSIVEGQGRYTEEEVKLQGQFIEASREKILGNYAKAQTAFKNIISKSKKNDAAYYELADIARIQKNSTEALEYLNKAIDLNSNNLWYQRAKAEILEKGKNYADAIPIHRKLIELEPTNLENYHQLAWTQAMAGKKQDALDTYKELEKRSGPTEDIARRKHNLYLDLGDLQSAETELRALVNLRPAKLRYRFMLAEFLKLAGNKIGAEAVYKEILEIDPGNPKARVGLVAKSTSPSGAEAQLESLKDIFPDKSVDIDIKIKQLVPLIGQLKKKEGDPTTELILDLAKQVTLAHPKEPKAFAIYGDILYHSGKSKEALVEYDKTVELDNSVFSVWQQMMMLHAENENADGLIETTERVLDVFPNQALPYYLQGVAHRMKNDHKAAIEPLTQAKLMSGKNASLKMQVLSELGGIYNKLAQYKKSDKAYDDALMIDPKDTHILNNYSFYLAVRGDRLDDALEMAKTANDLDPNRANFQDTYGWIYFQKKKYKEAAKWIKKALDNGGKKNPEILEHYGDVLYKLKKSDEALTYWQRALDAGSKSDKLLKKVSSKKLVE